MVTPAGRLMAGVLASNRTLPAGVEHLADLRGFLELELGALQSAGSPEAA